jgi:predicted DNA-binding transcriptional regulator AlpA
MKQANTSEPSDKLQALPNSALLRLSTLKDWGLLPLSRSTLWRKIRSGDFPQPVKVSSNAVAWRVDEIRCWLDNPSGYRSSNVRSNGAS